MGSRTMMAFRSFLGGRRKELSMQELNYDGCSSDYFSRNYSLLLRPPAHPPFPGFPSSREPFVTPKKSICSFFFFGGGQRIGVRKIQTGEFVQQLCSKNSLTSTREEKSV